MLRYINVYICTGFLQTLNRKFNFALIFAEGDTQTQTQPLRGRPDRRPLAVFKPFGYIPFYIESFHYMIPF